MSAYAKCVAVTLATAVVVLSAVGLAHRLSLVLHDRQGHTTVEHYR